MSESKKLGKRGQILHSQSREIINNVIQFFEREAKEGIFISVKKVMDRVLQATGISKNSYYKVKKESSSISECGSTSFETPRKKRPQKNTKCSLDDFDVCALRRIVHNFYLTDKEVPTVKKLNVKLKESGIDFKGCDSSLNKLMKKIGFKWRKTTDNRTILIERHEIRQTRISFLRSISQYRSNNRPIIYVDESYIHSSHTTTYSWSDGSSQGLKSPVSKGKRLIIVHAGGESGFVKNALLIFESGKKTGDYHSEMNFQNFSQWLKEKLLPNIPNNSVIILDNASYHNALASQEPNSNTKKQEMINWLLEKDIPFDIKMTKPELYSLIKLNKPKQKSYKIDNIIKDAGHTVLRLPPYHPELNAIEKIWALVKNWVASKNITFKISDVRKLAEEKFQSVTQEEWTNICNHVKKEEVRLMEKEHLIDESTEQLIIRSTDSDDEESDLSGIDVLQSDNDD